MTRSSRPGLAIGLALLSAPAVLATAAPAAAQVQDYRAVVPASAESDAGLFHVHRVGDRILFEIPDSILGRDMVLMSRFARTQEGLSEGGARMAPNMVVRWERRDDRVFLRAVSHSTTADGGSAVQVAVENSNFPPVLQAFGLKATGQGTSVIDVTDLYLGDTPAFSFPRQQRSRLGVRGYDRERSWLEFARSFPINVEIRVVRTYNADQRRRTSAAGRCPSRSTTP
jgi:hypothetical protein